MNRKVRKNLLRRNEGNALIMVLVMAVLLGIAAMIVPQIIRRTFSSTLTDEDLFEAEVIVSNMLEVGRYLLLYEKAFYTERPLSMAGADANRGFQIRQIMGQPFGSFSPDSIDVVRACGFYDTKSQFSGTFRVNGESVFCPVYFRDSTMSGAVAEQLAFDGYLIGNKIPAFSRLAGTSGGGFRLTIDNFERTFFQSQSDLIVPVNFGERLLGGNLALQGFDLDDADKGDITQRVDAFGRFFARDLSARIFIDFQTDSADFASVSAERFVKITAELSFQARRSQGESPIKYVRRKSETLVMSSSTPMSYAVFSPYPRNGLGAPATEFSDAVKVAAGKRVNFKGRVYFNGDLDLANLPDGVKFEEAVLLTGQLLNNGDVPNPDIVDTVREKFRKGVVTNFTAERYLFDGQCVPANPASDALSTANNSLMDCAPGGLDRYIEESCQSETGAMGCNVTHNGATMVISGCGLSRSVPVDSTEFLEGCYDRVTLNPGNDYLVTATPARRFTVLTGGKLVGTLFGGHIDLRGAQPVDFYSIDTISADAGGMTEGQLDNINAGSIRAVAGVRVPLINFPLVTPVGREEN